MVKTFLKLLLIIFIVTLLLNCFMYFLRAEDSINRGHDAPRQPYVVRVMTRSSYCTGVILTNRVIAFAKHCRSEGDSFLFLGEYDLSVIDREVVIQSTEFITDIPGDLTLAILPYEIIFNDRIQPISITQTIKDNALFSLYGWGVLPDDSVPQILQTTNQVFYSRNDQIICTRDYINESSASSGDSGGPLVQDGKLVGIISFLMTLNGTKNFTCAVNMVYLRETVYERINRIQPVYTYYFPIAGE